MENEIIGTVEFDVPSELRETCIAELKSRIRNMQEIPTRYYISDQLRGEGKGGLDFSVFPFD